MSLKKQECFKYSNRDKIEEIKKTISWAKTHSVELKQKDPHLYDQVMLLSFQNCLSQSKDGLGGASWYHKAKICKRKMKNNRPIIKTYH